MRSNLRWCSDGLEFACWNGEVRLKQFRRVATRYDNTQRSFSAFLALAAAKIWLPYFVNRA
ncbi:transposase [Rhizobium sp. BK512]|nr:transposase [Rhizobium sp. BK512]